jgi:hypothetical protein
MTMADHLTVLDDTTFEAELESVETALIFCTERARSRYHESYNVNLAALIGKKGQFFLAYIDDSPLLCRAYGIRVIDSYCLISRGRLLDSYVPRGSHDLGALAMWCDDVLSDRPRKRRYMDHITSKPASAMISYLKEMEEEERSSTRHIRSVLLQLDQSLHGTEEDIHKFLWSNAFLLDLFYEGGYMLSKWPLGNKHISDFVVFGYRNWTNDVGIHATLIEIEKPSRKLFTKAGDPASVLTHALRQLQDWKAWHARNSDYFSRTVQSFLSPDLATAGRIKSTRSLTGFYTDLLLGLMDQHVSCSFKIIAGRRADLTLADRIRLDEMNNSLNGISIMTYDALLEGWMRRLGSVV